MIAARRLRPMIAVVALTLSSRPVHAGTVLLKNAWLTQHMNRVTATSSCHVDRTHPGPNPIGSDGDDGDLHTACRCTDIGLPMVAEIVNAAQYATAVAAAKNAASLKTITQVTGVWRLWLEHAPTTTQTQGGHVAVPTNTNPAHSFEIHPITRFDTIDLLPTFAAIPGYKPYNAKTAFAHYESRTFTVSRTATFTSIQGPKALYNYAGFKFTVAGAPKHVADGWFVLATIDGVVTTPRRMVVADGTAAATLIAKAKPGMHYQALGIPRIDLSRIDAAIAQHAGGSTSVTGAYEMIIVSLAVAH